LQRIAQEEDDPAVVDTMGTLSSRRVETEGQLDELQGLIDAHDTAKISEVAVQTAVGAYDAAAASDERIAEAAGDAASEESSLAGQLQIEQGALGSALGRNVAKEIDSARAKVDATEKRLRDARLLREARDRDREQSRPRVAAAARAVDVAQRDLDRAQQLVLQRRRLEAVDSLLGVLRSLPPELRLVVLQDVREAGRRERVC
jgi:hypothetical protein